MSPPRGPRSRRGRSARLDWDAASRYAHDPSRSPGFALWRDFLTWQRSVNALLAPLGITQPQFSILASAAWLMEQAPASDDDGAGEVSQQAVANFTGMDRMLVSQLVRKLEAGGLLARNPSARDARAVALTLTGAGARCLQRALPLVEEHDLSFFKRARRNRPSS